MAILYTGENIVIDSSSKLTVQVVYPDLPDQTVTQVFNFDITDLSLQEGIDYSMLKLSSQVKNESNSCNKSVSVETEILNSVYKTAIAYSSLKDNFSKSTYEEYVIYVKDNQVLTLFADETLQYPFPFVFDLSLNPGDYFTIPDTFASVYIEGKKDYTFENDNLVCRFTVPMATDSTVTIISDYCLRLCIDTLDSNKTSIITTAWTNIPVGNFISSGSTSVILSVDGINYSRVVQLTSNKIYLKGIIPVDSPYGFNITNVVLKMVTCEAIDEYTF